MDNKLQDEFGGEIGEDEVEGCFLPPLEWLLTKMVKNLERSFLSDRNAQGLTILHNWLKVKL